MFPPDSWSLHTLTLTSSSGTVSRFDAAAVGFFGFSVSNYPKHHHYVEGNSGTTRISRIRLIIASSKHGKNAWSMECIARTLTLQKGCAQVRVDIIYRVSVFATIRSHSKHKRRMTRTLLRSYIQPSTRVCSKKTSHHTSGIFNPRSEVCYRSIIARSSPTRTEFLTTPLRTCVCNARVR